MEYIKSRLGIMRRKLKIKKNQKKTVKDVCFEKYYEKLKEYPNIDNPTTFGDKIQWIKINADLKKFQKYADKYEVREYIEQKIGKDYLIDLIDVYENVDDINFEKLPKQFVLKGTHGSGYNIVVKDKAKLNINIAKYKLNYWLNENFYEVSKESQYKYIKPRIVCEKFIQDKNGDLKDYKIFCFNGSPKYIEIHHDRVSKKLDYYDTEWNKMNLKSYGYEESENGVEKPKKLDEMLSIAKKLSEDFPFVRVDLYYVDDKIYFGELTLTPASGNERYIPIEQDMKIAQLIDLNAYK